MLPNPHIGHEATQTALMQLVASGRLPHALLFHGPKGVGKRQLAERLAYHVLCPSNDLVATEQLGHDVNHPLAAQLDAGGSVGLTVVEVQEKKKSIAVEQVRNAMEKLSLSADHDRFVIIDSTDNLSGAAANAILKHLEEPNAGVYFILLSHRMSGLLPTIVSRCRRFHCGGLSLEETQTVLQQNDVDTANIAPERLKLGAPGQIINLGDDDPLPAWQAWLASPNSPVPKGDAVANLDALLQALAHAAPTQPQLAALYQHTLTKQQQQQGLNLPAQVVLDSTITDIRSA